jgi:uncharacterized protein YjbI with pentapeptide repeats
MAANIDPLDVGALERSVNDSAGRVSGIWLAFVASSAYVAAAASMITDRQIFLEDPIKLPTINIDLPLIASAILMPLLFVIYHLYVLLQVVLLSRTADAYNQALDRSIAEGTDRTLMRQRLANTLFAQIFAGSPREREGLLGWLLRLMAWITLAIAPVCVLLVFEFKFLPYHSAIVTWTHRGLILIDLLGVMLLWAGAVRPREDIGWRTPLASRVGGALSVIVLLVALLPLTYPGERHTDWMRRYSKDVIYEVQCRPLPLVNAVLPVNFDRLVLPSTAFVDNDKVANLDKVSVAKGQKRYEGDPTRRFRGRDLRCGNFSGTDLRRVEFAGASLAYASFANADLQGARFAFADLNGTSFIGAHLQDTAFFFAELPNADLTNAELRGMSLGFVNLAGANFEGVDLRGRDLGGGRLQGASFKNAQLQGAKLDGAHLEGADFSGAHLEGASFLQAELAASDFGRANLQGAIFQGDLRATRWRGARLQGARLNARLQGADFRGAQLQGARFDGSDIAMAQFAETYLWGAGATSLSCDRAQITDPKLDPFLDPIVRRNHPRIGVSPEEIERHVADTSKDLPEETAGGTQSRLRSNLQAASDAADARNGIWSECARKALPAGEYAKRLVAHLVELACAENANGHIANGIARHWVNDTFLGNAAPAEGAQPDANTRALARGLLGRNGKACPGANDMSTQARSLFESLAN